MLLLDPRTGCDEAAATSSFGGQTLQVFHARALREVLPGQELGDRAMS